MSLAESREETVSQLTAHGNALLKELRVIDQALRILGCSSTFLVHVGRRAAGRPSAMAVAEEISNITGISVDALTGHGKSRSLFHGRLMLYWFTVHICNMSCTEVGMCIGGRDHSCVSHGLSAVRRRFEFWPDFQREFLHVQERLCARFEMVAEPVKGCETQCPCERFTPIVPSV